MLSEKKIKASLKEAETKARREWNSWAKRNPEYYKDKVFKFHGLALKYKPRKGVFENSNNLFNPATCEAYSYDWWQYVRVIRGKVVFNNHNYSMTTCGHQCDMRRLLEQLGIRVHLFVDMRESLTQFQEYALKSFYKQLIELEIALARKGAKPALKKSREREIKRIRRDIALARRLGAKFNRLQEIELRHKLINAETHRLAEAAEASARRRAAARGPVFNPLSLQQL